MWKLSKFYIIGVIAKTAAVAKSKRARQLFMPNYGMTHKRNIPNTTKKSATSWKREWSKVTFLLLLFSGFISDCLGRALASFGSVV